MIHQYKMNGMNIVLDVNGGAVHLFDDISYDVLFYYPEHSPERIAELLPQYTLEEIRTAYEEISALQQEGLLFVSDDQIDVQDFLNREPVIKALCLHVVHDCNLKCEYCFAKQGDFGGHKAYMTEGVGKKALDFLIAHSGKRKFLEVDFFGGEPLMDFELIKTLVAYGQQEAPKHGKAFRFTLTTNGVLLTDDKIDYINKHMHNVVLSLDGRKEINDRMRKTVNDKGSYDLIVPKFQKLIAGRRDKYYYVRGTFTKNNLDFSKDVRHFKDLGFQLSSIEPVVDPDENPYAITEEDLPTILKEYETLAAEYADMQKKGEDFKFFHFMVDLTQGPCVYKRVAGCGAGSEYLAISPEGDIYPCHQFVGDPNFKMGNLLEEPVVLPEKLRTMFKDAHVYTKDDCKNCWAKFYCSGGCHANAYHFNGDINKPYALGCAMQKKRTECAIMVEVSKTLEK